MQMGARTSLRCLPPGVPLSSVVQTLIFWRWPHRYLEQCSARYGSRFTINPVGMEPMVFMSDPSDIRAIVTAPADTLHPGIGAAVIAPLVGKDSFMLIEEEQHMCGRKTILPAFHHKLIEGHARMVSDVVEGELETWPVDREFAIHPYLCALTLRVILKTIFGREDSRVAELHKRLLAMLSITASLALQEPQLRRLPGWHGSWRGLLAERSAVDGLMLSLIGDRARGSPAEGGILAMLLGAENPDGSLMSTRQVRDNLMSIVLAGHETTAAELAWAFQLLVHNPRVLEKLIDELDGGDGEEYLTATIQEVLRHRPVFLFAIPRVVMRPIEIGGWTYPPKTQLLGCIYLVHHDPEIYPEPHEFRPERFLGASPSTYAWLPWGGGRKRCPGLHLAMLEMKTVLRTVLATMTVRPASSKIEHPRWRSVIVTPHAGSRVVLERR
jgi:cytochrome P450